MKKWWAQDEKGKLVLDSGLWVQCDLLFTVTSGKAQCQGQGDGDSCHPPCKHHREQLGRFLSDNVHLKETTILLHWSFYLWTLSRPSSHGRAWAGPTLKSWEPRNLSALLIYFSLYSLMLTCQKLRALLLSFLKGEVIGFWPKHPFKFCIRSQNATSTKLWTKTTGEELMDWRTFFFFFGL